MTHVNDLDKMLSALMEYAARFFHEVRTREDVYARFVMAFNQLAATIEQHRADGRMTPELAEAWSWFSTVMPALAKVAILAEPPWGTRELEQRLNDAYTASLRRSKTVDLKPPAPPRSVIHATPPDAPPIKGH
jgi:hypothetical protein